MNKESKDFYKNLRKLLDDTSSWPSEYVYKFIYKSNSKNIKILSQVVLKNFKPMIPKDFHNVWARGIESDEYFLKLCGSGGGGYILGFAKDYNKAKKSLSNYNLEVVYNF